MVNQLEKTEKMDKPARLSAEDWALAALDVIAESGLASVAVEPLAKRLGVTKGSFYWHFPSRDALLVAALERSDAGALADGCDRVGRRAAQIALARRQSRDASADHVRAQRCHHTGHHSETHKSFSLLDKETSCLRRIGLS